MLGEIDSTIVLQSGEGYNAASKVSFPSKVHELTEEICAKH